MNEDVSYMADGQDINTAAAPGPPERVLSVHLAPVAASVRAARVAVQDLEDHLPAETLHSLQLLVTELTTNVVRHANATCLRVTVTATEGSVRGEVRDNGRGFAPRPRAHDEPPGGWGLMIVDEIADRYGVDEIDGGGAAVWFELALN